MDTMQLMPVCYDLLLPRSTQAWLLHQVCAWHPLAFSACEQLQLETEAAAVHA